jgi:hypothetical protein
MRRTSTYKTFEIKSFGCASVYFISVGVIGGFRALQLAYVFCGFKKGKYLLKRFCEIFFSM